MKKSALTPRYSFTVSLTETHNRLNFEIGLI